MLVACVCAWRSTTAAYHHLFMAVMFLHISIKHDPFWFGCRCRCSMPFGGIISLGTAREVGGVSVWWCKLLWGGRGSGRLCIYGLRIGLASELSQRQQFGIYLNLNETFGVRWIAEDTNGAFFPYRNVWCLVLDASNQTGWLLSIGANEERWWSNIKDYLHSGMQILEEGLSQCILTGSIMVRRSERACRRNR